MALSKHSLFRDVLNITSNYKLKDECKRLNLTVNNVVWEDSARGYMSSVGPNITDMTLQVDGKRFPFIRQGDNFTDLTADLPCGRWKCNVSNMDSSLVEPVSLKQLLNDVDKYIDAKVDGSLWLPRDEKILTSAQTCILPLSGDGDVEFNVSMHNYQYRKDDPAVLAIVVSPHGTSIQLLTEPSQKIYLNDDWHKANYKAKRLEDVRKELGKPLHGPMDNVEKQMNALFIFQVPLVQQPRMSRGYSKQVPLGSMKLCAMSSNGYQLQSAMSAPKSAYNFSDDECEEMGMSFCEKVQECGEISEFRCSVTTTKKRGMDNAQLFIGSRQGVWDKGSRSMTIKRNPDFPIRCTMQFYRVTDNSDISSEMLEDIATQITKSYKEAPEEDKGSLVTTLPSESGRVTAPSANSIASYYTSNSPGNRDLFSF